MKMIFRTLCMILALLVLNLKVSRAEVNVGKDSKVETGQGGDSNKKTSYGSEKKFNFSFEPIVLLVGYVDLNLDIKLSDSWTFGPTFTYWRTSIASGDPTYTNNLSLTALALGVRGNWFRNGVFQDGWYASPVVQYLNAKVATISNGQDLSASVSVVVLTGLFGYHWFWDSFNLRLGGGLSLKAGPSKIHVESSNSSYANDVSYSPTSLGLAFDFMTGWTF